MGYDIDLTSKQLPEVENDAVAGELPPLRLTEEQGRAWDRIVERVRSEIGAVEAGRYPTHLELWLKNPAMHLWYNGRFATIEVPYWHAESSRSAQLAIGTAYALAGIVEAEAVLAGVDPQIKRPVHVAHVRQAAAYYRGAVAAVNDTESGRHV